MRLIDLDQTVFVPIVDESKGGVSYEMQITLAEFFDKFLGGFKPEVVDAIPVEWLFDWRNRALKEGMNPELVEWIEYILQIWSREREA